MAGGLFGFRREGGIRGMNFPGDSILLEKRDSPRRPGADRSFGASQPGATSDPFRRGECDRRDSVIGPDNGQN